LIGLLKSWQSMTAVWNKIESLAQHIEAKFAEAGTPVDTDHSEYDWHNRIFTGEHFRRAHIEIVDNRESHKIYILHCTIFPHTDDGSPIWGFDAVCGPNKITGAFHDFSMPGYADHPMAHWWALTSGEYKWNKPRELPEWAQKIFSTSMVAAGNVSTEEELTALCDLATNTLDYYLSNVGMTKHWRANYRQTQNLYCHWQKQNPHVVRSMVAMGVEEPVIRKFVDEVLFPICT